MQDQDSNILRKKPLKRKQKGGRNTFSKAVYAIIY